MIIEAAGRFQKKSVDEWEIGVREFYDSALPIAHQLVDPNQASKEKIIFLLDELRENKIYAVSKKELEVLLIEDMKVPTRVVNQLFFFINNKNLTLSTTYLHPESLGKASLPAQNSFGTTRHQDAVDDLTQKTGIGFEINNDSLIYCMRTPALNADFIIHIAKKDGFWGSVKDFEVGIIIGRKKVACLSNNPRKGYAEIKKAIDAKYLCLYSMEINGWENFYYSGNL